MATLLAMRRTSPARTYPAGPSVAQRGIDRAGDLVAGAGAHGAAESAGPALVAHRAGVQSQVGEDRGAVDMRGDPLGTTLGGDVLDTDEPCAATLGRDPQKVLSDVGDRTAGTSLPRRVGRGVDDHLPDDPPARVTGIAARHEKPRQRIRDDAGVRLVAASVEMPERFGD